MKWLAITVLFFSVCSYGEDPLCKYYPRLCENLRGSSAPAYPSKSASMSLNPSNVPIAKGYGLEMITYKGYQDFSIVKGNGRVGAALSPTNSEESFFGSPGFERDNEYLRRHVDADKYSSQKMTLGAAAALVDIGKSLTHLTLNLGVMGKYNKVSRNVSPGGGLSGTFGPMTFGYSKGGDEYNTPNPVGSEEEYNSYKYMNETSSVGLLLGSLALDYSRLHILTEADETLNVELITASILFKKLSLTGSRRREISGRKRYNYETRMLEFQEEKTEFFGGVQVAITRKILVGAFYNYYLLHEYSAGLTMFF